jgi:hypothetical protein
MKKRVQIALGAVGIAPAVGALALAPAAQAATAHAPAKAAGAAKSVRLLDRGHALSPDITCGSASGPRHRSPHGLRINTVHTGSCIHYVQGQISHRQTHLSMRTRIYEFAGGPRVYSHYNGGTISPLQGQTYFTTYPNVHGSQVCIALVSTGHHSRIEYGPVCSSGL